MHACLDVGYDGDQALAACVVFEKWTDAVAAKEVTLQLPGFASYVPGNFFRRELPCLLAILNRLENRPQTVVIDGYVWLDDAGTTGLGGHLFAALHGNTPVIGVAKTRFGRARFANARFAREVFRGKSRRPLYVTAAGMPLDASARLIASMHGQYRIPALLKRVDQLTRPALRS
jgi:deoxyribonuclease V